MPLKHDRNSGSVARREVESKRPRGAGPKVVAAHIDGDFVDGDKVVNVAGNYVRLDRTEINIRHAAILTLDRRILFMLLGLAGIIGIAILLIPQLDQTPWATGKAIDKDQIGIAVAEFAVGSDLRQTAQGREMSRLVYDSLESALQSVGLSQRVELTKIPVVRTVEEAKHLGSQVQAAIVLWGWIPEGWPDSIIPNFTLTDDLPALRDVKVVEPLSLMITGPNTIRLNQIIGRTTALSRFVLGLIYLRGKTPDEYQQALQMFKQGIADLKQDIQKLSERISQTNDIDTKTALENSKVTLELTLAIFYTAEGVAHATLGEADEARVSYEAALTLDPNYARAYIALGDYYYVDEKFDEAKSAYGQALEIEPDDSNALYGLGLVDYYLHDFASSINELERSIQLTEASQGEAALAYLAKGYVLEGLNRSQEAIAAFRVVTASKTVDDKIRQTAQDELTALLQPTLQPTLSVVQIITLLPTLTTRPTAILRSTTATWPTATPWPSIFRRPIARPRPTATLLPVRTLLPTGTSAPPTTTPLPTATLRPTP